MARGASRGSVYRVANGSGYRGAVTIDGKRHTARGRTKADVWAKLDAIRERDRAGLPQDDKTTTVGEFLERWLSEYAPARPSAKSPNTLAQYEWAVRKHLIPALGRRKLHKLRAEHVEAMLRDKAADGMAKASVSRLRSTLTMALSFAERRDLVARNVSRLAELPADVTPAKEGRSLTVEQARALLDAAEGDRWEALVLVALMLGLRPGELCGLEWDDIDTESGTLRVRQALKREPGGVVLGEPKTPRSRRTLDVPSKALDALARHRKRQVAERLALGESWDDSMPGLVFRAENGSPLRPEHLRTVLGRLTKAAGLGYWTPRELRHSAASILSASGVPLEQVADVLGHDGTRMTGQVYRHAVTPSVGAAVAPMSELFGE